jgi:hypothetical protein
MNALDRGRAGPLLVARVVAGTAGQSTPLLQPGDAELPAPGAGYRYVWQYFICRPTTANVVEIRRADQQANEPSLLKLTFTTFGLTKIKLAGLFDNGQGGLNVGINAVPQIKTSNAGTFLLIGRRVVAVTADVSVTTTQGGGGQGQQTP